MRWIKQETIANFEERPCTTEHLQIHGWTKQEITTPNLRVYGVDAPAIEELVETEPGLAQKVHPDLPYIGAEVVWAVRQEMARTVEDVLSRRTRALLLGARASIEAAPESCRINGPPNWVQTTLGNVNRSQIFRRLHKAMF